MDRYEAIHTSVAALDDPVVAFHTCSSTMDVHLTVSLENLLLAQETWPGEVNETTAFDVWFHSQVWDASGTYNAI